MIKGTSFWSSKRFICSYHISIVFISLGYLKVELNSIFCSFSCQLNCAKFPTWYGLDDRYAPQMWTNVHGQYLCAMIYGKILSTVRGRTKINQRPLIGCLVSVQSWRHLFSASGKANNQLALFLPRFDSVSSSSSSGTFRCLLIFYTRISVSYWHCYY